MRVPRGEGRPTTLECVAVYGNEIELDTGRNLERPVLLRKPSTTNVAEGSHIIKKGDWYYLFTAEGGTGDAHQEWVFRSKSPLGPYETGPDCPIVFNDQDMLVRTTGHMDILQDSSEQWWGVMLGTRPQLDSNGNLLDSHLGRETFLVPITWSSSGWPVVNDRKAVSPLGWAANRAIAKQLDLPLWHDEFDQGTLTQLSE